MSLSFNTKGNKIYPRWRHKPYQERHLSNNLNDSIRLLRGIFKSRNYIAEGVFSQDQLDEFENQLKLRLRGGNKV